MTSAAPVFHTLALAAELAELVGSRPGQVGIDCTAGGGSATRIIAAAVSPGGVVIAMDRDVAAIEETTQAVSDGAADLRVVKGNYADFGAILDNQGQSTVDVVIADLGISGHQLLDVERGISFRDHSASLDMRLGDDAELTAAQVLQSATEPELTSRLNLYGEGRFARAIARTILAERDAGRMQTVGQLVRAVERAVPPAHRPTRVHVATRTWLAVRAWVNRDVEDLGALLQQIPDRVNIGGLVAIITWHQVEDAAVKAAFAMWCGRCFCKHGFAVCNCGKRTDFKQACKPMRPIAGDIAAARSVRSATLRAVVKTSASTAPSYQGA